MFPPVVLLMSWSLNRMIKICCPCKTHFFVFQEKKKRSGWGWELLNLYNVMKFWFYFVILWGGRSWTVGTYWIPSNSGYSMILHTCFPKLRRKNTHSSTLGQNCFPVSNFYMCFVRAMFTDSTKISFYFCGPMVLSSRKDWQILFSFHFVQDSSTGNKALYAHAWITSPELVCSLLWSFQFISTSTRN